MLSLNFLKRGAVSLDPRFYQRVQKSTIRNGWGTFSSMVPKSFRFVFRCCDKIPIVIGITFSSCWCDDKIFLPLKYFYALLKPRLVFEKSVL